MKLFLSILAMLPQIINAVKVIEEFLPIPGKGKEKLGLITSIATDLGGEAATMVPIIERIVARVVGFANAFGIFKKVEPPAPSA